MIGTSLKRSAEAFAELQDEETLLRSPTTLWKTALGRLFRRKTGIVGMILVGFMLFLAIAAPLIAPHDPLNVLIGKEDGVRKRSAPCIHMFGCDTAKPQHILGVDGNVRDLLSRIIYGARVSLSIGFTTVAFAVTFGVILGAIAGYWGGWLDNIIMRVMDVILGFPSLLLAIAIVAVLGPGIRNALLAIAIVTLPAYARVMRASVLTIKELDYIAASKVVGSSKLRILLLRVLPNALTPIVVLSTLGIAGAILDAAGLSFLGLGAQPPTPEWGSMLGSERNQVFSAPHLVFFPGFAIMITVLGFNLLGDGMRDALDPRLND
jgi:ABC-type dipeptide/oligopeptide/nickel transport system permease subunit